MSPHRILLTGANGFVASHILAQLLSASHSVRAVVRSASKASAVRALHPSSPNLDVAIVPDMTAPGAFDTALQSDPPFDIVMHTASPFLMKAADSTSHFLEPAIKGTTEVLEGVKRVAGGVRRIVLTSSFAAVGSFGLKDERGKVYDESDWDPVTLEMVEENTADKRLAYRASKTFAERAAWDVVEKGGQGLVWDLVVLNPPMIYGPLAHKVAKTEELNESTARIYDGFLKDQSPEKELPPNGLHLYVDVRDIAQAHVLAMDAPHARNKRFFVSSGSVTSQQIADILREKVPGAVERVPKGTPGANTLAADAFKGNNTRVKEVLGLQFRSMEETFSDLGRQLVEIEASEQ
ncbi:3-beta hydroxysteroid dehydrogenase/isomerase family protein-like protein [Polyplosphaeria fusca]|uniref:3-beta hydroxysteroid dehydrogenase/isomerase family protein-like protein n=1 Tax=Polyplosphaeria fusca TaxID=682080 RepID=A0A9P4R4V2_9PLEO|nr:3-beta hydroxysteroid dehydrogenase/isomerase family protein-like protein [Polyplosphaeria fusca]